jgi:translation initiation factor IF-3
LLKPNDRTFTADQVRLIGPEGEQMDVVSLSKARDLARNMGLDLVLVSDRAVPPVVRIMNFGKLQYEQKKSLKAQRKNQATQKLKEVKFHVNIDKHDYETKLKHALDFLEKGCKLKITLALRGREMAHQELAFQLMDQVMEALAPYADADGKPKMLGRNISVNFAPRPAGSKKKGVKKETEAAETSAEEIEAEAEEAEVEVDTPVEE